MGAVDCHSLSSIESIEKRETIWRRAAQQSDYERKNRAGPPQVAAPARLRMGEIHSAIANRNSLEAQKVRRAPQNRPELFRAALRFARVPQ